jgi:UDP-N-acetylmuramoylalanine--D-glutamate ligase
MSKSILILGAGESGVGAAKLALALGYIPYVSESGSGKASFISELDTAGVDYEIEGHRPENWPPFSIVIKSPGIPDNASIILSLKEKGVEIISEIEFASRHASGKVIAITGANGKTTTTALIHKMLTDAGINAACVGNIGTSWARDLAERQQTPKLLLLKLVASN